MRKKRRAARKGERLAQATNRQNPYEIYIGQCFLGMTHWFKIRGPATQHALSKLPTLLYTRKYPFVWYQIQRRFSFRHRRGRIPYSHCETITDNSHLRSGAWATFSRALEDLRLIIDCLMLFIGFDECSASVMFEWRDDDAKGLFTTTSASFRGGFQNFAGRCFL